MSTHRVRLPRLVCGVLLALWGGNLVAQEKSTDWAQFRGPGGLGVSSQKGLPTKWSKDSNVVWKTDLPGAGGSSPIVVGEQIFLTCYSGYNVPGQPRGSMEDLKRYVVCLEATSGKEVWKQEVALKLPEQANIREAHGYASNTPVADAERVYVFFGKSGVFAFDRAGKQLWQADVGSKLNGWGSATSPILHGDLVIVNASVESDALVALDRKTGKEKWRARGIRESWATPILVPLEGGKVELVVPIQGKVLGFDPDSGEQLWSCATDITWYMAPSPVAHEGIVYCIGGRSGIAALAVRAGGRGDVTSTHRLWTGRKGSNVSSPVFQGGYLYWVNDSQGIAFCAEAKTGKIVYEVRLPRGNTFYPATLLADGKIYHVDRAGKTFVLAAGPTYELLSVNDLSDRSMFNASPTVLGKRLLLRSDRALYCVGQE